MTHLILTLFIKDYTNTEDKTVRLRYGTVSGMTGIICNLFLFMIKIIIGVFSSAISITADAFNNLSDAGSSIITLIGFKMAGKPADKAHPYGHGRIEYLSSLFISVFILLMAVELFKTSFEHILHPEPVEISMALYLVLIFSILLKCWMFFFNRSLSRRIHSSALKATATDSISDTLATLVVLISMFVQQYFHLQIDGWAGFLVALFIFYAGIRSAWESSQPLIGSAPDQGLVEGIYTLVTSHAEIKDMHDLLIHNYGPTHSDISLHVEMSAALDLTKAHAIIDTIENELKQTYDCDVTIHIDPVAEEPEK